MADTFAQPIPDKFLEDAATSEWARGLTLFLDNLTRTDGAIDTIGTTTTTVLTQGEKLDLMTVTALVNLDTVKAASEASTATLATVVSGSPAYTITNDGTDRTFSADAAAGAISATYVQAEIENIRDGQLELADVVATLIRDLIAKGVFSV